MTDFTAFAQFGLGGIAVGMSYALVRWALGRADEDRKDLAAVNEWARTKFAEVIVEVTSTMKAATDLVERMADRLDGGNPRQGQTRRPTR